MSGSQTILLFKVIPSLCTMRIFHCELTLPVKAVVSVLLIELFIILYYINDNLKHPHLPVPGNFTGASLQRVVSVPSPVCSPGVYTEEELKPHLQRPPQDPRAPGANGRAFVPLHEKLNGLKKKTFNQFASDRISLHRDLGKDTRHPDCLAQKFQRCPGLPTTSVIVVFNNEAWSTLLRTVYSVLHTAPAALLTEILLVDDASTDDHLKTRLDNYVRQLNIVRVLRQRERKGLTAARLMGAQAAKGEVLTFLDSHCECFPGWLEPLLARIVEQPTAVVSPNIASINLYNLKFNKPDPEKKDHFRGNFDWALRFGWEHIPEKEKKRRTNETYPIRTPTFAGGLFSVSKSYFEHIGTYDEQMEFWGGENLEMSFRVWQCGGQLESIPCSVVGHIFHIRMAHPFPNGSSTMTRNLVRLAEVWMDDYKWVFYRTNRKANSIFKKNSFGDVSERRKLREKLKCRNFAWYLNNIYPEAYVPDILPVMHGQLENIGWNCFLDVKKTGKGWGPVQKFECRFEGVAQRFEYTSQREVRLIASKGLCLHASSRRALVSLKRCRLKGKGTKAAPEQVWTFTQGNHLKNPSSGKCLTVSKGNVIVTTCKSTRDSQNWVFI